jgi:hypothetical protein
MEMGAQKGKRLEPESAKTFERSEDVRLVYLPR